MLQVGQGAGGAGQKGPRELSADCTWILVQSVTSLAVAGIGASFVSASVGEGEFSVEEDRERLAPVVKAIVKRKLTLCLQRGDLPGYRRHLNLQGVHLRSLDVQPLEGILPSATTTDASGDLLDPVAKFLKLNGFRTVSERDEAGWFPLHYAALSGNIEVVEGLLFKRANIDQQTTKNEGTLGIPPGASALECAIFGTHNELAKLLIAKRAKLDGSSFPTLQFAAVSNNAEGAHLLCAAGCDPDVMHIMGHDTWGVAAAHNSVATLKAASLLLRYTSC